ncbi:MAG TPA: SCO family protein, partial [Thermoanaerobaculia bacterium]|nr:SCO family protein [Thermoanaerobaculia bacterium]
AAAQRPPTQADPEATASGLPEPLREVGFDQRLGEAVPLDLVFRDASGSSVRLGDFFDGRPVALALVYYDCPMLCPLTMSGLARSLKPLEITAGEEFELVTVSFDPRETAATARAARDRYLPLYGRQGAADGWHFLTGDAPEIARLADAVGFRYTFDEERGEYAHAAGLVVLTPEGRIARYFFGTDHSARDLRLAFVEASAGTIGNAIDQVLLYCFHYDPATGRYSAATWNLVRAGAALTVLALAGFIVVMLRRERRARRHALAAAAPDAPARTA